MLNGYVFFFGAQRHELLAASLFAAKEAAVAHFKPAKSKRHLVHGMLAEKDGEPVIHSGAALA